MDPGIAEQAEIMENVSCAVGKVVMPELQTRMLYWDLDGH